jgi:Na+/H+ antiporter NhaD/arsenite permease-like protein
MGKMSVRTIGLFCCSAAMGVALPGIAFGAAVSHESFDGTALGMIWVVPFIGVLLSIAVLPLLMPSLWHHHFGKISLGWAAAFILPFAAIYGPSTAIHELLHTALLEYVPFIILLFALFTVAGGIYVKGNLHGSPGLNTGILLIGTIIASWMGTTGAAMLLIRPLIRANDARRYNAHTVIFFIFLVANIGGALTPLGDPPLFLGFLKGVDFFWTTTHLFGPTAFVAVILLVLFFALDTYLYRKEGVLPPKRDPTPESAIKIEGAVNFALLAAIVAAVLLSGTWHPGKSMTIAGVSLEFQNLARDALLLIVVGLSIYLTPHAVRNANGFTWAPIAEVAKLFAAIFVTIIPAIAILRAGTAGALASVVRLVTDQSGQPVNAMYFWLSGGLSSFLDNAPTYLVFFNAAGGDASQLMGPLSTTLLAISAGSVFMGANTYIGNAPNFMVKAIAEEKGIAMPSFFGYMLWSGLFLVPSFVLVTLVFFR